MKLGMSVKVVWSAGGLVFDSKDKQEPIVVETLQIHAVI
jgi:hypothetical protein